MGSPPSRLRSPPVPPDRASTTSPAVTLTEPPWPTTPSPMLRVMSPAVPEPVEAPVDRAMVPELPLLADPVVIETAPLSPVDPAEGVCIVMAPLLESVVEPELRLNTPPSAELEAPADRLLDPPVEALLSPP